MRWTPRAPSRGDFPQSIGSRVVTNRGKPRGGASSVEGTGTTRRRGRRAQSVRSGEKALEV